MHHLTESDIRQVKENMARKTLEKIGLSDLLMVRFLEDCNDPECCQCLKLNTIALGQLADEDAITIYVAQGAIWVVKRGYCGHG